VSKPADQQAKNKLTRKHELLGGGKNQTSDKPIKGICPDNELSSASTSE